MGLRTGEEFHRHKEAADTRKVGVNSVVIYTGQYLLFQLLECCYAPGFSSLNSG